MSPRTVALYVVGSLLAYLPVLGGGFVSDDFVAIEALRRGDLLVRWGLDQGGFFRPVTVASLWLDVAVHGGQPAWMHVENAVLHALCACLVHALTGRLTRAIGLEHRSAPAMAGLLFLVHPSHGEVVAWISGRGDLLATLFGLAGVVSALEHVLTGRKATLALAAGAWTLASFSKESALATPGIALALSLSLGTPSALPPRRLPRSLAVAATGAIALGAWLLARAIVFGEVFTSTAGGDRFDLGGQKILSALRQQSLRTFVPALVPGDTWSLAGAVLAVGCVATTAALFVRSAASRARHPASVGLLAGLVVAWACSLIPAVGARVPVASGEGERFVYLGTSLASIGIAVALASLPAQRLAKPFAALWIGTYLLLLVPVTSRWNTASGFAAQITDALATQSRGPRALVLNLPDSVGGAYVFRNGLAEAVKARRSDLVVGVVATFTADRQGKVAGAVRASGDQEVWELVLRGPAPYHQIRSPSLVQIVERRDTTRVLTRDLSSFSDLFVFDGLLRRVQSRD